MHHVVGRARPGQGIVRLVGEGPPHRLRQLLEKERPVVGTDVFVKVLAGDPGDLIQPATEELGVFRLLPEEAGQVDLLLQPALAGDGHDERQKVEGYGLLACLKEGRGSDQVVPPDLVGGLPIEPVPGEVECHPIPGPELLRLLKQPHWHGFEVDPTAGDTEVLAAGRHRDELMIRGSAKSKQS